MATPRPAGLATAADLATSASERGEILDGVIVEKAGPSYEHGDSQRALCTSLGPPFHRRGGGPGAPGGWWIATEVEVELETHEVFLPDLVGWRRDRVPERPTGRPVRVRPDWVCEILSPSNAENDLVHKLRVYQRCTLPHYWIVDPERKVLVVHRWTEAGYVVALTATAGETVRAEPFEAIELAVGVLFGEEPT